MKKYLIVLAIFIFGIPSALSNSDVLFANWSKLYGKSFFMTFDDLVSVWLLPIAMRLKQMVVLRQFFLNILFEVIIIILDFFYLLFIFG